MPDDIILPAVCMRFGAEEEYDLEDLQRQLRVQNTTAPVPIRRVEDVLLFADGTTARGLQFTTDGFSGICQRLLPTLFGTLGFLVGLPEATKKYPDRNADPELAISIYNEIVRQYFDSVLVGHRLIIDPNRSTIDGIVGPRYEFLGNQDWFQECQSFVHRCAGENAEFLGASLAGRRLLTRYVIKERWFQTAAEDGTRNDYRRGWSFSNQWRFWRRRSILVWIKRNYSWGRIYL